jgi:hypothetical protein
MLASTIKRLLTKMSIFAFMTTPFHASAGLLSNIETETTNTAEEILEVLMPIASYDPSVVQIRVINDGIKVFEGIDKDLESNFLPNIVDDANISKYLNAKDGEILLSVPVEVTLNSDHISNLKNKLSDLADVSETVDGSSNNRITKNPVVWFEIGSIKGNPRTELFRQDNKVGDMAQPFRILGMKNSTVGPKSFGKQGPWVHKPFVHYSFGGSHNNGQLCNRLIEKIAAETKPFPIWDKNNNNIRPGTFNSWNIIFPAITIKFLDKNNKVLLEDLLVLTTTARGFIRTASASGYGNAISGQSDTFQSIVTLDTKNGWHPQDSDTLSRDPLSHPMRFAEITNVLKMYIDPPRQCSFGVAEQTNFSIITKVNGDIVKNTDQITVSYRQRRDWMEGECLLDLENNVNCRRY